MDAVIESCISTIQYPNSFMYGRMEVLPLFSTPMRSMEYLTLDEALASNQIIITEVSEGGSVPQLKVVNKGKIPVLLIDGEEIAGAKQNRVLNTTILVPALSELTIPVSCTEHGRWSYDSPFFSDSNVMMDYKIRQKKMASVSFSLKHRASRQSDQSEIWSEIADMSSKAKVSSPTGAMKDVYESYSQKMKEHIDAFPLQPGQQGILVYMDNQPAGMEFLSRPEAYARIHEKLIRSYALEALIDEDAPKKSDQTPERPRDFLQRVRTCRGDGYPAVGLGTEYRLEGKNLMGSALLNGDAVVHLAFFSSDDQSSSDSSTMAGFRTRRAYRSHRAQNSPGNSRDDIIVD